MFCCQHKNRTFINIIGKKDKKYLKKVGDAHACPARCTYKL